METDTFCLLGLEAAIGTVGIVMYVKGDVVWTLL
jgi:hypothetical protein